MTGLLPLSQPQSHPRGSCTANFFHEASCLMAAMEPGLWGGSFAMHHFSVISSHSHINGISRLYHLSLMVVSGPLRWVLSRYFPLQFPAQSHLVASCLKSFANFRPSSHASMSLAGQTRTGSPAASPPRIVLL